MLLVLVVLVLVPDARIAIVPAAPFGIIAWVLGMGPRRAELPTSRPHDRPFFTSTAGSYRGALAAIVAATGLAGLADIRSPDGQSVLVLVFALGWSPPSADGWTRFDTHTHTHTHFT